MICNEWKKMPVSRTEASIEASVPSRGDKITNAQGREKTYTPQNHKKTLPRTQNGFVSPTASKNFSMLLLRLSALVLNAVAFSSMLQSG